MQAGKPRAVGGMLAFLNAWNRLAITFRAVPQIKASVHAA